MYLKYLIFGFVFLLGAISMSILFLSFKPAVKLDGEHRKPYHYSYMWIGTPIEVSK